MPINRGSTCVGLPPSTQDWNRESALKRLFPKDKGRGAERGFGWETFRVGFRV